MAQIVEAPKPVGVLRRHLTLLLAILLIAAVVTLLALASIFAGGDANPAPPPTVDISGKLSNVH